MVSSRKTQPEGGLWNGKAVHVKVTSVTRGRPCVSTATHNRASSRTRPGVDVTPDIEEPPGKTGKGELVRCFDCIPSATLDFSRSLLT